MSTCLRRLHASSAWEGKKIIEQQSVNREKQMNDNGNKCVTSCPLVMQIAYGSFDSRRESDISAHKTKSHYIKA